MNFFDYFKRPYADIVRIGHLYTDGAAATYKTTGEKQAYHLFNVCFGHHLEDECNTFPKSIDENNICKKNPEQLISSNLITAHFMEKYYNIPRITDADDIKREYDNFLQTLTADPIERGNRMHFLTGEAGEGKTLFCNKIRRSLNKELTKFKTLKYAYQDNHTLNAARTKSLIPIYINTDKEILKESLNKDFDSNMLLDRIFLKIKSALAELSSDIDYLEEFQCRDPQPKYLISKTDMRRMIDFLYVQQNIRFLIIFDNLDRYYFHYSKYVFFEQQREAQYQKVNQNITNLIRFFIDNIDMGALRLCVLFVTRKYVYNYLVRSNILNPLGQNFKLFEIKSNRKEILRSRVMLYRELASLISTKLPGKSPELDAENIDKLFKISGWTEGNNQNHVYTIATIGRQGNRSFIDFVSSLKVLADYDFLIERFITRKQRAVILLYIVNKKYKYTQAQEHFPNLFLNDSSVCSLKINNEFKSIYNDPHKHTYWIKYLLLNFIYVKETTTLNEILLVFCRGENAYPESLVRLALGSLNTDNDFKCVKLDESIDVDGGILNIMGRPITMTKRGKYLVQREKRVIEKKGEGVNEIYISFCFNFLYLQLVIDDYLLALPKDYYDYIFLKDKTYDYLLSSDLNEYKKNAASVIEGKAKAVMYFIQILKASLEVETLLRVEVFEELEKHNISNPDFGTIEKALMHDVLMLKEKVYKT